MAYTCIYRFLKFLRKPVSHVKPLSHIHVCTWFCRMFWSYVVKPRSNLPTYVQHRERKPVAVYVGRAPSFWRMYLAYIRIFSHNPVRDFASIHIFLLPRFLQVLLALRFIMTLLWEGADWPWSERLYVNAAEHTTGEHTIQYATSYVILHGYVKGA